MVVVIDALPPTASGRWLVLTRSGSSYVLDLPIDGSPRCWKSGEGAAPAEEPRVLHTFTSLEGGPVMVGERMTFATTAADSFDDLRVRTTSEVVSIRALET